MNLYQRKCKEKKSHFKSSIQHVKSKGVCVSLLGAVLKVLDETCWSLIYRPFDVWMQDRLVVLLCMQFLKKQRQEYWKAQRQSQ